jgi:hypothetical protein
MVARVNASRAFNQRLCAIAKNPSGEKPLLQRAGRCAAANLSVADPTPMWNMD